MKPLYIFALMATTGLAALAGPDKQKQQLHGWDVLTDTKSKFHIDTDLITAVDRDGSITIANTASNQFLSSQQLREHYVELKKALAAAPYRGRIITFRAKVKLNEVNNGAGLWLRIESPDQVIMTPFGSSPLLGTTGWVEKEISLAVPNNARGIFYGFYHIGDGQSWFDDWSIERRE